MIFEVCVDSVDGALAAQEGGAQRVELCADLVEGGMTPSLGMLRMTRRKVSIGVNVLIRPRGGDFCFSALEYEVMREDIQAAKEAGADGVVLGLLLPDGQVDTERTRSLVNLARPLSVTFHRAFDLCRDPREALETLVEMGIDRVLTSGCQPDALRGAECIAGLVRQSAGRIAILAGGGISAENLPTLLAATQVQEVHFSARESIDSPMRFRRANLPMGKAYQPDEYAHKITSAARVRQVVDAGKSWRSSSEA